MPEAGEVHAATVAGWAHNPIRAKHSPGGELGTGMSRLK
jgi:hypothetical protein